MKSTVIAALIVGALTLASATPLPDDSKGGNANSGGSSNSGGGNSNGGGSSNSGGGNSNGGGQTVNVNASSGKGSDDSNKASDDSSNRGKPNLSVGDMKYARYAALFAWSPGRAAFRYEFGVAPWPFVRTTTFLNYTAGPQGLPTGGDDSGKSEAEPDRSKSAPAGGVQAFTAGFSLVRIVEYNDSIPIENSTSFVDLTGRGLQWSPFAYANVSGPNGTVIRTATSNLSAGTVNLAPLAAALGGFTANFSLEFTGKDLYINRSLDDSKSKRKFLDRFLANELKYSFGFAGFPYKYENSNLAIVQGVAARNVRARQSNATDGFTGSSFFDFNGSGYQKWISSVQTDLVSVDITTDAKFYNDTQLALKLPVFGSRGSEMSVESTEKLGFVVFKLGLQGQRPNSFYWDPTVGAQDPDQPVNPISGDTTVMAPTETKSAAAVGMRGAVWVQFLALVIAVLFLF